jgi:arylsulfatase A-like enzyme
MKYFPLLFASVLSWTGAPTAGAAEPPRPNILVIVADDLGYGELSCQGNPQIPTPHIDSLAKHGVRFTSGYVSGPYCSPTRAGLLTGRYQQRFGHEFNPGPAEAAVENFGLSLKEATLAERLKAAGYATGMFGKWHLGYKPQHHPTKRGFDEYFGFLGGAHPYLNATPNGANPIQRGTTPVPEIDYTTDAFGREAAAFIEKHKSKSWFVYLPFNAVHAPLQTLPKYRERFAHIKDNKRQTFAAMLSAMDDAIGVVLAKLREHKLEENTLIFFVSDNGGPTAQTSSKNDPLRGHKAQVWEGGIRVPFLVQWKGRISAGKVDDRPVIQLDIHPTALAAAGVAPPADVKYDGVNLLPYLTGEKSEPPHAALFWRFGRQRAVRAGDWKLTDMGTGAELFNVTKDIGEKENLAAKEPEKLKELEAAYQTWNAGNIVPSWKPPRAAARRAGQE